MHSPCARLVVENYASPAVTGGQTLDPILGCSRLLHAKVRCVRNFELVRPASVFWIMSGRSISARGYYCALERTSSGVEQERME